MSEFDKELSFTNTPLENLRTILSEADASVEPIPQAQAVSATTVSKSRVARLIEQLTREPQQFLSPAAVDKMLSALMAPPAEHTGARSAVFDNKAVSDLDRLLRNYQNR